MKTREWTVEGRNIVTVRFGECMDHSLISSPEGLSLSDFRSWSVPDGTGNVNVYPTPSGTTVGTSCVSPVHHLLYNMS